MAESFREIGNGFHTEAVASTIRVINVHTENQVQILEGKNDLFFNNLGCRGWWSSAHNMHIRAIRAS